MRSEYSEYPESTTSLSTLNLPNFGSHPCSSSSRVLSVGMRSPFTGFPPIDTWSTDGAGEGVGEGSLEGRGGELREVGDRTPDMGTTDEALSSDVWVTQGQKSPLEHPG